MNINTKILELGCGKNKRIQEALGIDMLYFPGVDHVWDLNMGMPFIDSNSVDEIYSHHFLEHLNDLPSFMNEVFRVLKPGGIFRGEVPHFSNPYYYSDPTHQNFFGLYTFNYFIKNQESFKRKVPSFYNDLEFELVYYQLIFKNPLSNSFISRWKIKILNYWFNKSIFSLEKYERSFANIFPSYELQFCIKKI